METRRPRGLAHHALRHGGRCASGRTWTSSKSSPTRRLYPVPEYPNTRSSTHLILSAQPEFARIGMKSQATPNLDTPTGLGMWVRKHAKGRRVGTLTLDQNDRVVTLPVAGGRLVLEVFGTSGLLCAVDDDGILRASAGRLRPELTMRTVCAPLPPKELTDESETPFSRRPDSRGRISATNRRKDRTANQQAIDRLSKALKKLKRLKRKVQADLDRCADAETYRIHGELLKGQLHRVQPGASLSL